VVAESQTIKESDMRALITFSTGLILSTSGALAWSTPPEATAYQMTIDHAGVTTSGGSVALQASPLWSVNLAGPISYPLIANGTVYVTIGAPASGNNGTQLLALDAKTGNTVWGPVSIPGNYLWSNATFDGGKVFVLNFNGVLASFDAATGTPGFSEQLPGQYAFSSPPTASGGVVYAGGAGDGGTVYAIAESSGAVKWTASVENGDDSSPTLSGNGVFVSYACPQTYEFDQGSGTSLWHYSGPCEGGGGKTTVYSGGKLYVRDTVSSPSGYVFDANTGALLSRFTAGPIPAVDATQVYYLNAGVLEAHDAGTGALLWSFTGDGSLTSAPIVVDQYVIIGGSSGSLYALDAQRGTKIWQGNVGAGIAAPDEQNVSQPLTGLGVADGVLIVPAGSTLVAYSLLGPAPPANLTAAAGPGQVNLSWVPVAGADSYQVFSATSAGAEALQPTLSGITGTSATITGLNAGTQYYFTVRALGGELLSFASNEASAAPGLPPPPTSLVATPDFNAVDLTWNASSGATGYNVYMGTAAGGESDTPVASNVSGTKIVISGLQVGTDYFFVVRAVTPSGLSAPSNESDAIAIPNLFGGGGGTITAIDVGMLLGLVVLGRLKRFRRTGRLNLAS
jgi:outer membrane protein assembly factor BamB